ncbi:hypothetical protein E2C01_020103 [Portunus trituberculatus]|uniref:Uncharacterized protein n=1 Tax=Portunus trituberculatus TaxID=210409 RepID=A0A5B7DZ34_PORTR|nr:hypothetical protein [Portunus trituberculatus]
MMVKRGGAWWPAAPPRQQHQAIDKVFSACRDSGTSWVQNTSRSTPSPMCACMHTTHTHLNLYHEREGNTCTQDGGEGDEVMTLLSQGGTRHGPGREGQLEDLSAAGGSNDSISGGYSRDDSLHHSLCQSVGHSSDACDMAKSATFLKLLQEDNREIL